MNIMEKQRLVEWLNDRLGLIYLGLYQLPECPGYWETMYEDEIEPLESIRALIESSGDKEQETDPFLSNLYGVKSAPSPAPTIKKDLRVEVEEAMDRLSHCVNNAHHIDPLQYLEPVPGAEADVELQKKCLALDWEALAVIKAALRPKVVTRKWIRKRADWAGCLGVTDVAGILRELGIEVSEGEMR